jgi:hypothetical protein
MQFEPASDRSRPEAPTRPMLGRRLGARTPALAWRAAKVAGMNLLVMLVLLIPVELYFGSWLDGPGAVSLYDATPSRVEVRTSRTIRRA